MKVLKGFTSTHHDINKNVLYLDQAINELLLTQNKCFFVTCIQVLLKLHVDLNQQNAKEREEEGRQEEEGEKEENDWT